MDLGIYNKQNITKRDRSDIEILLEALNKNIRSLYLILRT